MTKKKWLVDVFRTYAHCVEIEATDEHEAEEIAYDMASKGKFNLKDFTLTDDIDVVCSGVVDNDGDKRYF